MGVQRGVAPDKEGAPYPARDGPFPSHHPAPRPPLVAHTLACIASLLDRLFPPARLPAPATMAPAEPLVFEAAPAQPATRTRPARGPEWRSTAAKDGFPKLNGGEVTTLAELFDRSVKLFGDRPCLGWRAKQVGEGEGARIRARVRARRRAARGAPHSAPAHPRHITTLSDRRHGGRLRVDDVRGSWCSRR